MDPVAASYGVDNALYAVTQLAQTTMRSELGKITLDKVMHPGTRFVRSWCGHANADHEVPGWDNLLWLRMCFV